jgi:hypothetical protein
MDRTNETEKTVQCELNSDLYKGDWISLSEDEGVRVWSVGSVVREMKN